MRQNSRRLVWASVALAFLLLAAVPAAGAAGNEGEKAGGASERNRQARIETTESGIEIELSSSRPFPVRALRPVLRIGTRDFILSRNPDDGRLDTLIFLVPSDEFEKLRSKDRVTVFYGLSQQATGDGKAAAVPEVDGDVWDFGNLQKDLLDQPAGKTLR